MIQQLSNELKPLNRHIGNFQHLTAAPVIYCNIPLWLLVRRSSLINLSKFEKICGICIYSGKYDPIQPTTVLKFSYLNVLNFPIFSFLFNCSER